MSTSFSTSFTRQVMPVFTPSAVSGEHLESITVGRDAELKAIENAFTSAASSLNRPNVLLIGPRGSGKTHLISLMMHRVSSSDVLTSQLAIVWLPEDVYTITTYTDLLRTMIRTIGGEAFPNSSDAGLEDTLRIIAGDQVIVLVAENFDRTLNLIGVAGQRALRAFQHNSGAFMMLASMPAIDEKLLDYDAPFYGAFQIIHLEDLTVDQGRSLLVKTAQRNGDSTLVTFLESPTGLARLRAVEHLAGGSPRLWLIISGLMTVELLDELVPLFLKMLDELTPYYKARMDELAPAKAKILAVLCRLGRQPGDDRTMSVKAVATECNMTQQTVSKQLHELEKARFVRVVKNDKDKRASYYEPREPLLKHCLELKMNKGEPLSLIVSFLAVWYSLSDLFSDMKKSESDYSAQAIAEKIRSTNPKQLVNEVAELPMAEFVLAFPVLLILSAEETKELLNSVATSLVFDSFDADKMLRASVLFLVAYKRAKLRKVVNELLLQLSERSAEWHSVTTATSVFYRWVDPDSKDDDLLLELSKSARSLDIWKMSAMFPGAVAEFTDLVHILESALDTAAKVAELLSGQTPFQFYENAAQLRTNR